MRTFGWAAVVVAVLGAVSLAVVPPALSDVQAAAAPVRIMPLGDSITAGPGCWRAMLWNKLQTTGYTNVDFVGGVAGGGCNYGYPYDVDHEGHGGYSAVGIADNNQLPVWLAAATPDVVLMHLGTNDLWGGWQSLDTVMAAYTKLIGQMRAQNPDVDVVVAQIIPMHGCTTCPADAIALNQRIPGWAAGLSTARSTIVVADLWTGFTAATDTSDGVHPNDAGFRKMADAWYPALTRVLGGTVPTATPSRTASATPSATPSRTPSATPSATPSRTPSATPSPTAGGACVASYKVASYWGGSFQGEVTVRNGSAGPSSAWTVTFTFADGQRVSQAWNATVSQTGTTVTARNAGYNGALAAGASAAFGFIATWNDTTNTVPAVSCTLS